MTHNRDSRRWRNEESRSSSIGRRNRSKHIASKTENSMKIKFSERDGPEYRDYYRERYKLPWVWRVIG